MIDMETPDCYVVSYSPTQKDFFISAAVDLLTQTHLAIFAEYEFDYIPVGFCDGIAEAEEYASYFKQHLKVRLKHNRKFRAEKRRKSK